MPLHPERQADQIFREGGQVISGIIQPGGMIPPTLAKQIAIKRLRDISGFIDKMRFGSEIPMKPDTASNQNCQA